MAVGSFVKDDLSSTFDLKRVEGMTRISSSDRFETYVSWPSVVPGPLARRLPKVLSRTSTEHGPLVCSVPYSVSCISGTRSL